MVDFIAEYHSSIEQYPVRSTVQPGYLRALLPASPPEVPEPLEALLRDVSAKIMPGITHWQVCTRQPPARGACLPALTPCAPPRTQLHQVCTNVARASARSRPTSSPTSRRTSPTPPWWPTCCAAPWEW